MPLPVSPFNAAKSIFAGLSVIQLKVLAQLTGVTAATTIITKAAHGLSSGDQVQFVSGTGFTGLLAGTNYFVTKIDATTFTLSATLTGSAISVGTSTVGVLAPVFVVESRKLPSKLDQEMKQIKRPDARGVLRNVRSMLTSQQESFTFEMDEPKRLLLVFGGALGGRVTGTATIWLPDPDDATGNVSLKSETDFACTITRDGDITFGDGDFSKASVMIDSNKAGAITWTADGTA